MRHNLSQRGTVGEKARIIRRQNRWQEEKVLREPPTMATMSSFVMMCDDGVRSSLSTSSGVLFPSLVSYVSLRALCHMESAVNWSRCGYRTPACVTRCKLWGSRLPVCQRCDGPMRVLFAGGQSGPVLIKRKRRGEDPITLQYTHHP